MEAYTEFGLTELLSVITGPVVFFLIWHQRQSAETD